MLDDANLRAIPKLLGTTVDGRYRVESLIGRGGMAWVFLAVHVAIGKRVALKVLRPTIVSLSDTPRERFLREARRCSELSSPHTVDVSDFGTSEGGYDYMVMEYLEGASLAAVLARRGSLPVLEAIDVAEKICLSLGEAHARGVVHRDLKPDNVFLAVTYHDAAFVKVLDFGIAKSYDGDAEVSLTSDGSFVGTPEYMAPEQYEGKNLDPRSDIYALGLILYKMLTGGRPFPPLEDKTPKALIVQHLMEPALPLPERVGEAVIPAALRTLVAAMLAKERDARPASADEVVAALREIRPTLVGEMATGELPRDRTARTAGADVPVQLSTHAGVVDAPKRSRRGLSLAVAGLAVVVGLVTWRALAPPESDPDDEIATRAFMDGGGRANAATPSTTPPARATADVLAAAAPEVPPGPRDASAAEREPPSDVGALAAVGDTVEAPADENAGAVEAPETVVFELTTHPQGASLTVDGEPLGDAPQRVEVKPDERRTARATHPGYLPRTVVITADSGPTRIVLKRRRTTGGPTAAEKPPRGETKTPPKGETKAPPKGEGDKPGPEIDIDYDGLIKP